jgi:hypothetical protein
MGIMVKGMPAAYTAAMLATANETNIGTFKNRRVKKIPNSKRTSDKTSILSLGSRESYETRPRATNPAERPVQISV